MPNRIEELFAELAESAGGQQQFQIDQQLRQQEAERELYDTDEARRALEIAGILGLVALPIPGSNTLAARLGLGQAGKPLINKSYGAVGGDMVSQTLKAIEQGTIGRSGSGVGADVAGRYALPKAKPSVVTKQGPRGPINIGQPPAGPPRPAPSRTTRLSETDREMIKRLLIPPLTQTGQKTRGLDVKNLNRGMFPRSSPYYPKGEGLERLLIPPLTKTGQRATQVSAKETARKARVEIKKLNRWKKGHQAKVRRGDDQYQEGMRSGYEPDIKGGEKMMRESRKRIQEIQAKLDELNKLL